MTAVVCGSCQSSPIADQLKEDGYADFFHKKQVYHLMLIFQPTKVVGF